MLIGVISDTHGLLLPEAIEALSGSDAIIHAGDVGDPAILKNLREIAPVTAVRGNVDRGSWRESFLRRMFSKSPVFRSMCCTSSISSISSLRRPDLLP